MSTRDRILYLLKTKGPHTAAELARRLGVTAVAVRQHLAGLESDGLVAGEAQRGKVGRPRRLWSTTGQADGHFPDSHGELAVGMLEALRAAFGQKGLDRLVAERTRAQIEAYAARLPEGSLGRKVAMLARIRTEEGYMAESRKGRDGSFTLIENHCPICDAARACQGLCAGEQRLFESVLGARVERLEHVLAGDRRCAYRISPLEP
ncbi:MAG: helix-turn-helix transcriptional regulator [Planctomycetota bacterium]